MSARIADLLLILFVGGYIVPGAILVAADLVGWMVAGHRVPYPVPPWPVGS